VAGAGIEPAT